MTEPNIKLCPVCGNLSSWQAISTEMTDRRKGLEGRWGFIEYDCCHCYVIEQIPSEAQLSEYYEAYPDDRDVDFSVSLGARWPWLRKVYHWLTGDIDPRDFVEVGPGQRVLDYGCGHAGYLGDFHSRGIHISGAEIAAYVVEACKQQGFDVRQVTDFSRIPFEDMSFDIVYLMQVFEHLREPHRFLDELNRVMKPEGTLYLAVPNAKSVWRKIFQSNWVSGWFAPFHLYHYHTDALGTLAKQHGFELVNSWSRTPESWFRLNLKAVLYPNDNRLDSSTRWLDSRVARVLVMLLLRLVELPLRNRDCLVVKLRKFESTSCQFGTSEGV